MADDSSPWNILMGYMWIPQPAMPPASPEASAPDYLSSAFPPNITGGRLLAVPISQNSSFPPATSAGITPPNYQLAAAGQGASAGATSPTFAGIPVKPGIPMPGGDAARMLQCMAQAGPGIINQVTGTSDYVKGRAPDNPHYTLQALDAKTSNPVAAMILGAMCGAQYQQNEYTNPSPGATGPHVHLQTRPGLGGATGPYYPPPRPIPRPDT